MVEISLRFVAFSEYMNFTIVIFQCVRRGRFEDPVGIKDLESCPSDCYQRSNCSQCIGEPGRCVWCQERQECFQFSVYIAEYQYGQCKAWIDKDIAENEVSNSDYDQQCQTCQMRINCSQCMEGMSFSNMKFDLT